VAARTYQARHPAVIAAHLAFAYGNACFVAQAMQAPPAALENELRQQARDETS